MVDRWIGMLLQKIEDLGLYENTAVIFTSDHGFYLGDHGYMGKLVMTPKALGYVPLYEEIIRVPLMIRVPDVRGGKCCRALVQPPDLTPIILELAEAKNPPMMQGRSLLPFIKGEDVAWRDLAVTSPSIITGGWLSRPASGQRITMTTNEWALMLRDNPGRRINLENLEKMVGKVGNELYDLSKDPMQKNNIYDKRKDAAEEIHSKLVMFLEEIGTKEEYLKYWRRLE